MLIINDFFARQKEASSIQMEFIKDTVGGKIVSATRFMRQKPLQRADIKDGIFIFPPSIYKLLLFFYIMFSGSDKICIFEEEPSTYRRLLCRLAKKRVYLFTYRKATREHAAHIIKYKYLSAVIVELESHKEILESFGIESAKIHIIPTPSKLDRRKNFKLFNPNAVKILFASWNSAEGNLINERGLVFLLDLLLKNPSFNLTILLRDENTNKFEQEVAKRSLGDRVFLLDPSEDQIEKIFDETDFVAFTIQKALTKDVPNSLVDGLSRGKPAILTDIFGFSNIIKTNEAGIVIKAGTKAATINLDTNSYRKMSQNAYKLSKGHSKKEYQDMVSKIIEDKI